MMNKFFRKLPSGGGIIVLLCLPVLVYSQKDSIKQKNLLVFPVIARSIETGWSFGGVGALTFRPFKADTASRTSNLSVLLLYSTKKQLVAAVNGSQYFNKEKFILNEQFSFSSFPDKFWGLGQHTKDGDEEPYKFKQYYVYLHLMRKVVPHLFAGLLFEKQKVWDITYQTGGKFDQQQVFGRHGYQIAGLGGSITWDSRNNAFAPDKGSLYQFTFNHFSKLLGADYVYTNYVFDLRKFMALRKAVLAFQLFSFNNTGDVPIRSLASFGGANRMRGYYDGRYKDKNLLVFQTEYRFPLLKRISAVVFGSTGNVGRDFTDYNLQDLKYSYGGGLRIAVNKKEKLNIRLDYGIGQGKNNGFYLQLGEAF
jgi:outer membrane protein assembly factor BamA